MPVVLGLLAISCTDLWRPRRFRFLFRLLFSAIVRVAPEGRQYLERVQDGLRGLDTHRRRQHRRHHHRSRHGNYPHRKGTTKTSPSGVAVPEAQPNKATAGAAAAAGEDEDIGEELLQRVGPKVDHRTPFTRRKTFIEHDTQNLWDKVPLSAPKVTNLTGTPYTSQTPKTGIHDYQRCCSIKCRL